VAGSSADTSALEGVIAGGVDYGDQDRIVRLLTPEHGRMAVYARGVRGGRKKSLAGALDPGTRVHLELRRGRGPLPILADAVVRASPHRARADLDRLALLTYGVEICTELAPEDHPAPKLYRLLLAWMRQVEDPEVPGPASRQALEAKALTFSGHTPALVGCAVCGDKLDAPTVFDAEVGGGLHGRCGPGEPVEPAELLRFEALRRTPLSDTPGVRPAQPRWLLGDFVRHQLGRQVKSRAFLEQVEAMRPEE